MSLLTRCPACITLYRVVPDQLRISDGWVKCGQCAEIFDASQHLVEEVCDLAPQGDVPLVTAPAVDVLPTQGLDGLLSTNPLATAPAAVTQVDIELDVVRDPEENPALALQALAPDEAPGQLSSGEQQTDAAQVSDPTPLRRGDETPAERSVVAAPVVVTPDNGERVTFLKGVDRPSSWQKPLVRGALMLFGLLLGLSLAAQWVYLERDRLAAQHPELKPMLHGFCAALDCQVQALKRIESLSVDSVGFHLLGKDTYRLTFTIKNASALPLALPNVELALTDTGDQPVYRRVFAPGDLAAAPVEIAGASEWPVAVSLRVTPVASDQRVFGYRLLAFYP